MITVLDIGLGNINSVVKALNYLDIESIIVSDAQGITDSNKIIFPGVGSFNSAAKILLKNDIGSTLLSRIEAGVPFLGICLGMQLLAELGFEGDIQSKGLGYIHAEVDKIKVETNIRLPHIGWNNINHDSKGIFSDIPKSADFYFVHSYCMIPKENIDAFYTNYSIPICAYVKKKNAYGVQFHPEKSQKHGLQILKNFNELMLC